MDVNSLILGSSQNIDKIQIDNDNKNKQDEEINKSVILCDYYYNLHLESYIFLNVLNTKYLRFFIISMLLSGIIELINYKDNISEYLYLVCGIINILLSIFFNAYKNIKLAETLQEHYDCSNKYKILMKKISTQKTIYDCNQDYCIYKNIFFFIKEINDEIDRLLLKSPVFPNKILSKYHINDNKLEVKSYDLCSIINIFCLKCNKIKIDTYRKKSRLHLSELKKSDIDNYENFLKEINKNNSRVKRKNSVFNI